MEWLTEKFLGRNKNDAADAYLNSWFNYDSSFETTLAAWDEVSSNGRLRHNLVFCVGCCRNTLLRRRASSPSCGPVFRSRLHGS